MSTKTDLTALVESFADLYTPEAVDQLSDYLQDNPHQIREVLGMFLEKEASGPPLCTEDDVRLTRAEFFVEIGGNDYANLWREFSRGSRAVHDGNALTRLHWQEDHRGFIVTVGTVLGYPVNISIRFARLDGHYVCFWEPCSMVVHYQLCEDWLKKRYSPRWDNGHRLAYTDAMNFHHCLDYCRGE